MVLSESLRLRRSNTQSEQNTINPMQTFDYANENIFQFSSKLSRQRFARFGWLAWAQVLSRLQIF